MSLPDPRAPRRRAAKQPPRGAHASEALEKLTRETREAVRGLESATGGIGGLDDEGMMEDFVKQFEEFAGAQVLLLYRAYGRLQRIFARRLLNPCW